MLVKVHIVWLSKAKCDKYFGTERVIANLLMARGCSSATLEGKSSFSKFWTLDLIMAENVTSINMLFRIWRMDKCSTSAWYLFFQIDLILVGSICSFQCASEGSKILYVVLVHVRTYDYERVIWENPLEASCRQYSHSIPSHLSSSNIYSISPFTINSLSQCCFGTLDNQINFIY